VAGHSIGSVAKDMHSHFDICCRSTSLGHDRNYTAFVEVDGPNGRAERTAAERLDLALPECYCSEHGSVAMDMFPLRHLLSEYTNLGA
jgi:hypothetical protein